MQPFLFTLIGFWLGAVPFSVWLGKWLLRQDVRRLGDHNPGATNVFRSGSRGLGLLVLLLDITKAAVPVGLAYHNFEIRGWPMFLVAIAPPLGHAFSPFLKFKGGKALAAVLGVWIGLTLWKASLAAVAGVLVGFMLFAQAGWAVMVGLLAILAALLIWLPDPLLLAVVAWQFVFLGWTHRADLRVRPRRREWRSRRGPARKAG